MKVTCTKCGGTGKVQVSDVDFDECRACYGTGGYEVQEDRALEYLHLKAFNEVMRLDQPWPLKNILEKLVDGCEILLKDKSYDGQGYEEIQGSVQRAKEIIEILKLKQ